MSMVVGVFESLVNAQDAVADLVASGYSRNAISLLEALPDEPQADAERALAATLEITGLNPTAAQSFADAICNGAVLVAVHCTPRRALDARDILDVYNDSRGPPIAQPRSLM